MEELGAVTAVTTLVAQGAGVAQRSVGLRCSLLCPFGEPLRDGALASASGRVCGGIGIGAPDAGAAGADLARQVAGSVCLPGVLLRDVAQGRADELGVDLWQAMQCSCSSSASAAGGSGFAAGAAGGGPPRRPAAWCLRRAARRRAGSARPGCRGRCARGRAAARRDRPPPRSPSCTPTPCTSGLPPACRRATSRGRWSCRCGWAARLHLRHVGVADSTKSSGSTPPRLSRKAVTA